MNSNTGLVFKPIGLIVWGGISVAAFIWGDDRQAWYGMLGTFIFIILPLILYLIITTFLGFLSQLEWAKDSNGFLGVIGFIFSWILILPIMLVWALIWGLIDSWKHS